jgi:tRNA modification GTPase
MTLAPSGAGGDKPIAMASAPDPTDAPTSATTLARHQSGAGEATIFATATGPGGAIAVMRVSGAATAALVATLAGRLPAPRVATLRKLRAADGTLLDRGLVLFNPAPRSYTGEDYAELHVHGGRAVRAALAEAAGRSGFSLFAPPGPLCTDNAVMVAWAGIERLRLGLADELDAPARPRWPLDELGH